MAWKYVWCYNTIIEILEGGMDMDMSEEIAKMNWYKMFEPYIDPAVSMEARMKGQIKLNDGAPEEAKQALAKWKAMKMKNRLF